MDAVEALRAWTYRRLRLAEPAPTPEAALDAVVAVYATHPTASLALWARSHSFTSAAYRALDADRRVLRIPAMRGTVFMVPARHASRVFTAVRPPASRVLRSLKRHDFSEADYEGFAERILAIATEPKRSKDLQDAAGLSGQPLGTVLRCLRYDGRVVALAGDSLNMGEHRYVATSVWAPGSLDAGDPGESLAWLAGEYLRAYGPARVDDFAWWAGVSKRAATTAVGHHDVVDVGDGLLLPADESAAFEAVEPVRGTVSLLPKWDAYTMGYAPDGRERFVHPDVQDRVYTPIGTGLPGDGNPVVLVDGEAVATWTFTVKDGPSVQPFDTLGGKTRAVVDGKLAEVAELLTG